MPTALVWEGMEMEEKEIAMPVPSLLSLFLPQKEEKPSNLPLLEMSPTVGVTSVDTVLIDPII